MSWAEELSRRAAAVNEALDRYLPLAESYPSSIHRAVRYSVFAGGKRLRGVLALAGAGLFCADPERFMPLAAACEMIHTYSLIHDDLPAMDNDDYRRGKPSNHKVFGEGLAILAGDALLAHAFQTIGRLRGSCSDQVLLQVIAEIAGAAGFDGLIGGQVVDLESEGKAISPETLQYIHSHKTGALFRSALRSGALLGGGGQDELEAVTGYAEAFGLVFQITDDLLDVTGDEKLLGKPVGRDQELAKATYPHLYGLDCARQLAAEQVARALQFLSPFGERAQFLREAVRYLLRRRS